jgi:hypothetical protein
MENQDWDTLAHTTATPAIYHTIEGVPDLLGLGFGVWLGLGFRGATFAPFHLPPHFHTYHRSTCKIWWDSGAPAVVLPLLPKKQRYVCPDGCTP